MDPVGQCLWDIDGASHRLVVEKVHQRYFFYEGRNTHIHPEFHFVLVSQGDCRLLIRDRPPVPCPFNSLVFINPLVPHTFASGAVGVEHSCLIGALRRVDGDGDYCGPLQALLGLPPERREEWLVAGLDMETARDFVRRLKVGLVLAERGLAAAAETAYFSLFLHGAQLVFPDVFSLPPRRCRNEEIVAEVRQIVESRIYDPLLKAGDLCAQVHLHRNRLNELFRAIEGTSVGEYIMRRRLQRATQLLRIGYPVSQVARQCGFGSHSHFTAIFRERFGCTPKQFPDRDPHRPPAGGGAPEDHAPA